MSTPGNLAQVNEALPVRHQLPAAPSGLPPAHGRCPPRRGPARRGQGRCQQSSADGRDPGRAARSRAGSGDCAPVPPCHASPPCPVRAAHPPDAAGFRTGWPASSRRLPGASARGRRGRTEVGQTMSGQGIPADAPADVGGVRGGGATDGLASWAWGESARGRRGGCGTAVCGGMSIHANEAISATRNAQ